MKKLIFILVIFASCSFSSPVNYSTTWAGTANNQGLTKLAFNDGQNTTKLLYAVTSTAANSLQLLTKDTLIARCNSTLNTSYPALSAKTSKQVIVKSNITLVFIISTSTSYLMCNPSSGSQTVYCDVDMVRFYTDAALTTPLVGLGEYYYCATYGFSVRINSSGYGSDYISC